MQVPVGGEGNLNGATAVDVVDAPADGKQRVIPVNGVCAYNADTVAHTYTFQKVKGASTYVLWIEATVAAGSIASLPIPVTLDATDEKLQVKYEAALTTTESTYSTSILEVS